MKFILLFVLGSQALLGRAESLEADFAAFGQLIVTQFVTAPFPHPSRASGYTNQGEIFPAANHYTDRTVAIFVPKDFRAHGPVDVVIHFHGWGNSVAGTLRQFQLIEQFTASRRNALLVVPEGPHRASDSAGGKLEDPGGFARFIAELRAAPVVRDVSGTNAGVGRIMLSGHSGGYRVMAAIVARGGLTSQIREVWLFDALYAEADKFLAWADQSPGRLLNIYTDRGGTKDDADALMKQLEQRGTRFLATEDVKVSPNQLRTNHFVFLHTDLGHNDVLAKRKTFQQFLETSCLNQTAE